MPLLRENQIISLIEVNSFTNVEYNFIISQQSFNLKQNTSIKFQNPLEIFPQKAVKSLKQLSLIVMSRTSENTTSQIFSNFFQLFILSFSVFLAFTAFTTLACLSPCRTRASFWIPLVHYQFCVIVRIEEEKTTRIYPIIVFHYHFSFKIPR